MTAAARRRRAALIVVACASAVAGAITGASTEPDDGVDPANRDVARCPEAIAADDRKLVGQLLMVRMEARPSAALLAAARRGALGGVILFPPESAGPRAVADAVAGLRAAARRVGAPQPLVAIDQEGGEVKRLPALAPDAAPTELDSADAAREAGQETGRDLAELGIDVDLAPVLDVAAGPGSAIAARAFGERPDAVIGRGLAFAAGLRAAGVAATAKHFPGLGLAVANPDDGAVTVAATRPELAPHLEPFARAAAEGVELVMTANATYPALDGARPASLSPRVVEGLLRDELGYEGAIVTDDLGAGAISAAGYGEAEAAVAAARAGNDLLLFALSDGSVARAGLLRALRSGRLERSHLLGACDRITALRERLAAGALSRAAP